MNHLARAAGLIESCMSLLIEEHAKGPTPEHGFDSVRTAQLFVALGDFLSEVSGPCAECNGTGTAYYATTEPVACGYCEGKGRYV